MISLYNDPYIMIVEWTRRGSSIAAGCFPVS